MSLELVTAPTIEVVTLDEAKAQCFVVDSYYDTYITSLIEAARVVVESRARQTLVTTTWRQRLECFPPCGIIEIYKPPLQSVTSLKYINDSGVETTWSSANYAVDTAGSPGRILRGYGVSWPSVRTDGAASPITIQFVAGRTTAAAVPAPFKHAMKLLIGWWFKQREDVNVGNIVNQVPMAAAACIAAAAHGSYP